MLDQIGISETGVRGTCMPLTSRVGRKQTQFMPMCGLGSKKQLKDVSTLSPPPGLQCMHPVCGTWSAPITPLAIRHKNVGLCLLAFQLPNFWCTGRIGGGWLCKPDDLSLVPRTHIKIPEAGAHTCAPGATTARWEAAAELVGGSRSQTSYIASCRQNQLEAFGLWPVTQPFYLSLTQRSNCTHTKDKSVSVCLWHKKTKVRRTIVLPLK